jgi:hypothetical protein
LPVPEFNKPHDERCPHQFSKGCRIYARRPRSCAWWNCKWLAGDDTGLRPDRAHYVIDMMPDFVMVTPDEGGEPQRIPVLQVWVEPGHDVTGDPALRAYIEHMGKTAGYCALLRVRNAEGTVIFPPSLTGNGMFHVVKSNGVTAEHSFDEIAAAVPNFELAVVVPGDRRHD